MKLLNGIRVLDLTAYMSGPFCTMIMADMGAEVIKLESPPFGDPCRYIPPGTRGVTPIFSAPNRGKKSVLMDLSNTRQRDLFLKMVKDADVVVENYKPGTMEKLGVGYEVLKQIKPDIILTSISGFGQSGPMKSSLAFDMAVQGYSGLMSVTGPKTGEYTGVGITIADIIGGLFGYAGTLTALFSRTQTGGQTRRYRHVGLCFCLSTATRGQPLLDRSDSEAYRHRSSSGVSIWGLYRQGRCSGTYFMRCR